MVWVGMCGFGKFGLGCVGPDDVLRCCGVLKCIVCLDDVVQDGGSFGYHKFGSCQLECCCWFG